MSNHGNTHCVSNKTVIGDAASKRTHPDVTEEDRIVMNQIVHSNDQPGTRYYNEEKNPFQGPQDKSKEAEDFMKKYK